MSRFEALTLYNDKTKVSSYPKVHVHTTVIFSILNNYMRRAPRDSRVMGTLLGTTNDDGSVTVTECYAVPFTEKSDEMHLDIKYHRNMYAFHRRNNKNEVIVGWYTTSTVNGQFIIDNTSLMYDFYSNECVDPVHLVVDTSLVTGTILTRGFVSNPLVVGDETLANIFQEVQVEVCMSEMETTCLYHMIRHQQVANMIHQSFIFASTNDSKWNDSVLTSTIPASTKSVEQSILDLQTVLNTIQQYVDDVVEGKIPPSREVGISIGDALNAFSAIKLSTANKQEILNTKMQDLLMVSYISTLTQTQTLISEKLNEIL